MARFELTAGYGSRHRWRTNSLRHSALSAHTLAVEPLEERRFLSATSTNWQDTLAELAAAAPAIDAPNLAPANTNSTSAASPDSGPIAEPAVIDVSGTSTTTASSLLAYGGPGDPNLPGFSNVGKGSTGNSTVTYLGNGWVLTAAHVTIDNQYGPIRFGDQTYQVDMSSIRVLTNPNDTTADLKIFRLTTDPGLPSILSGYLATQEPEWNDQVFMIGNGYTPSAEKFWHVTTTTSPWTWTEQSAPRNPGSTDVAGWTYTSNRAIRWGDNRVQQTSMFTGSGGGNYIQAYTTQFDKQAYTSYPGQPYEAQATNGDSGGAVFRFENGRWVLSGIMISVTPQLSGQPAASSLYGSLTFIADISFYRDELFKLTMTSSVAARNVFYNLSKFDGQTAGASESDDLAIAPDKFAYLPGTGTATYDNITSYTSGINGIMVDIAGAHGTLTADDFYFKIGNSNTPETWVDAPTPDLVQVRPGAGVGGSDRVEIIWTTEAPKNTWLQVTVRGNDALGNYNTDTGLATSNVFYYGNRVGDYGSGTAVSAITNLTDEFAARNNAGGGSSLLNIYDYDRNGSVQLADALAARNNAGTLVKINLGASAAAPTVESFAIEAPAPAIVETAKVPPVVSAAKPQVVSPANARLAAVDSVFQQLAEALKLKVRTARLIKH